MAEVLDSLAVIFPFEVECYKDVDLPVSFVGHPFVSSEYKSPFTTTSRVLSASASRQSGSTDSKDSSSLFGCD